MAMSDGRRANDDSLYEPDAIAVGILLFGATTCPVCGLALPECSDYFVPDRTHGRTFKAACRRCRRARQRARYSGGRQAHKLAQLREYYRERKARGTT